MRQPIQAWSFPDSGAQVCMLNSKMVAAMNGAGLVAAASLQIKDAGGHNLPVDGAIFIVITRKDRITGLSKRTHQMAYVCQKTEDLVSRGDDESPAASVRQISSSAPTSGCGPECSGCSGGGPSCPGGGVQQDEGVSGGQLTLDLIASHNQSNPNSQVSPGDLKPVNDPDHICRGTLSLKRCFNMWLF